MYVLSGQLRLRLADHDFVMKRARPPIRTRVRTVRRRRYGTRRALTVRRRRDASCTPGPAAGASVGNAMRYMMLSGSMSPPRRRG